MIPHFNTLTLVLIALTVGLILGGFIGFWFEDVLRGPIVRAYDDDLESYTDSSEVLLLTND